jgi:hypothetical protein
MTVLVVVPALILNVYVPTRVKAKVGILTVPALLVFNRGNFTDVPLGMMTREVTVVRGVNRVAVMVTGCCGAAEVNAVDVATTEDAGLTVLPPVVVPVPAAGTMTIPVGNFGGYSAACTCPEAPRDSATARTPARMKTDMDPPADDRCSLTTVKIAHLVMAWQRSPYSDSHSLVITQRDTCELQAQESVTDRISSRTRGWVANRSARAENSSMSASTTCH